MVVALKWFALRKLHWISQTFTHAEWLKRHLNAELWKCFHEQQSFSRKIANYKKLNEKNYIYDSSLKLWKMVIQEVHNSIRLATYLWSKRTEPLTAFIFNAIHFDACQTPEVLYHSQINQQFVWPSACGRFPLLSQYLDHKYIITSNCVLTMH